MSHRITPTHGGRNSQTNKRTHKEAEAIDPSHPDVIANCEKYKAMLCNLMDKIQEYLLLSDDNNRTGALCPYNKLGITIERPDDNMICVWLDEYSS